MFLGVVVSEPMMVYRGVCVCVTMMTISCSDEDVDKKTVDCNIVVVYENTTEC